MIISIYSRKSKFTGKGESVENQISLCKEYAEKHFNADNILVYEDEGFSGGNTDRPQFQKMMDAAKKKKFDVLICYRLDRISRNISDFSNLINLLQDNNIAFVSIREQFDTSTPLGRAMMFIASVFAQLERETIAERIRDNMLQLARSGRWLGGVTPTGYKSEPITYYDRSMNKKKMYTLSPIPEELETVKLLYSKYIELGSLTQLEGYCFENAIQSKNSKNYDKSALRSILTNPVYAIADELLYEYFERTNSDIANTKKEFDGKHGVFVYNKNIEKKGKRNKLRDKCEWIIAIGKHPGIINSIDWIKVQKMIEENSVKAPRTGTSKVALLTPLLTCAKCKSKLRVSYKVQNGEIMHHYYKCLLKERSRGTQCDMKNLNGQKAEQLVIEHFKKMASDADGWLKDLDDKKQGLSKISKKTSTNKLKLEKELKQHETSISNLTIQLSQNNSSAAAKYIIQQIETLDKKIADIKHELNTSENAQESNMIEQMNIEIIKNFVKSFASSVDDMEFDEKKRALKEIVKEIIWDGKHLDIKIFE